MKARRPRKISHTTCPSSSPPTPLAALSPALAGLAVRGACLVELQNLDPRLVAVLARAS
jgi:hypothetical protein